MTAEEYLETNYSSVPYEYDSIVKCMVEFARHHVDKALYQASVLEQVDDFSDYLSRDIIKRAILEAYPLSSIK